MKSQVLRGRQEAFRETSRALCFDQSFHFAGIASALLLHLKGRPVPFVTKKCAVFKSRLAQHPRAGEGGYQSTPVSGSLPRARHSAG